MNVLFVLRAVVTETYDCPDNGLTNICERYEDIQFDTKRAALDLKAVDLNKGHTGFWSEKRAKELRRLHAGYGSEYTYSVNDISHLLREEVQS